MMLSVHDTVIIIKAIIWSLNIRKHNILEHKVMSSNVLSGPKPKNIHYCKTKKKAVNSHILKSQIITFLLKNIRLETMNRLTKWSTMNFLFVAALFAYQRTVFLSATSSTMAC